MLGYVRHLLDIPLWNYVHFVINSFMMILTRAALRLSKLESSCSRHGRSPPCCWSATSTPSHSNYLVLMSIQDHRVNLLVSMTQILRGVLIESKSRSALIKLAKFQHGPEVDSPRGQVLEIQDLVNITIWRNSYRDACNFNSHNCEFVAIYFWIGLCWESGWVNF